MPCYPCSTHIYTRRFADIPELRKFGLVAPDIEVAFDDAAWNNGAGAETSESLGRAWAFEVFFKPFDTFLEFCQQILA